jgi:hypothetical protein
MTTAVTDAQASGAGHAQVPITATTGPQAKAKAGGPGRCRGIRGGSAELQHDKACATLTA